jgi:hypothetical protein
MPHKWRKDSADDCWHCVADDEDDTCCGVGRDEWIEALKKGALEKGDGGKVCKCCFDHWLSL